MRSRTLRLSICCLGLTAASCNNTNFGASSGPQNQTSSKKAFGQSDNDTDASNAGNGNGNNSTDAKSISNGGNTGSGGGIGGNGTSGGSSAQSLGTVDGATSTQPGASLATGAGAVCNPPPPVAQITINDQGFAACAVDRSQENQSSLLTVTTFMVKVYDATLPNGGVGSPAKYQIFQTGTGPSGALTADFSQVRASLYTTHQASFPLPVPPGNYVFLLCDANFQTQCNYVRAWATSTAAQDQGQSFTNDQYQDYFDSTSGAGALGIVGVGTAAVALQSVGGANPELPASCTLPTGNSSATVTMMVISDYTPGNPGGTIFGIGFNSAAGQYAEIPGVTNDGYCTDQTSPLMLDLSPPQTPSNQVGIWTTPVASGITFAIRYPGVLYQTSWLDFTNHPNQAALALDKNGNGTIDSGDELFGNYTFDDGSLDPASGQFRFGPDGPGKGHPRANHRDANGFEALKRYDANGDGRIDAADPIWSKLVLWQGDKLTPIKDSSVLAIYLDYRPLERQYPNGGPMYYETDANGDANHFRSCLKLKGFGSAAEDADPTARRCDRMVVDVWFQGGPVGGQARHR